MTKQERDIQLLDNRVNNSSPSLFSDWVESTYELIDMIENMEQYRPHKPNRRYVKKLNYYKEKLKNR